MSIIELLNKYYSDNDWCCGDTYETLNWNDTTIPKPTQEHLKGLWNEFFKDEMREQRNQLLQDSDYTALPDFPSSNKQAWLNYRQELRDFPSVWSVGVPFPTKPIL